MARLSLHRPGTVVALLILVTAASSPGQITALHVVSQPTPAEVLPGYVANDLLIDFTGLFTGSQMLVELTSGSIYQDESPFAGITPPPTAVVGLPEFSTIQWDTFLAQGGPTSDDTVGNFGPGGAAIKIDSTNPGRPAEFSDSRIDQSWNAAGETVIEDRHGFMVARVTLSSDANGTLGYISSANQIIGIPGTGPDGIAMLPIRNGVIIPEPSTVVLLGISILGLILLKGRRA